MLLGTMSALLILRLTNDNKQPNFQTTTELPTTPIPVSGQNITIGSRGKGFIVLFMKNFVISTKNIYVTSENGVQMNMSTSEHLSTSLKSQIDRVVSIPSNQHIIIPREMELTSFQKETKSILIETSEDVFVISHADGSASVGSTTHIPLHKLSTKYIVITTEPASTWKSQLAVAAIENNTTVSITFKMRRNMPLNINGVTFYNNDVFNVTLNRLETYQIEHVTDLTGTVIESSTPIAAFSGNDCNTLGGSGACDHLIEQLPPTEGVDNAYIVPPNSDDRDTIIRVTALENSNITYTIGSTTHAVYLNQLTYFDTQISSSQTCFVESENPILVTGFGLNSKNSDLGDPSMTIIPGLNQYLDYYKIVVPAGYVNNYVSIMIKQPSRNSFRINGTMINTHSVVFESNVFVGNGTYNVRSIRVTEGELTASTVDGERFELMFAGVTDYEAYGFSGNSMLL
nr:IgGFc-binding protein-like isoform X2 [Crassostrea virginica]